MYWRSLYFLVFFLALTGLEAEAPLNVNAAGAILVDGETGKVLYEKNADQCIRNCQYVKNDD